MKKQSYYRFSSLLLTLLILVNFLASFSLVGYAANVTKIEKKYDIAVVFDNSGSMYQNEAWCRAKYAMEIFASMLNYSKDKLHIFPMWEVTTDGSKPNKGKGGSYAPIEIKSETDINKISNLFTVNPSNTPFAPISEAHDYLCNSSADEKWLVILTDGAFNEEKRGQSSGIDLQNRVSSLASKDIKVQYLGFGKATELKSNEANNFFAKKSTDTSLKDDLIGICNAIFQRSVLPNNRLNGTKLNIDLSMKNVIVFVQGANAKITSLKNSSGKEISKTLDSGQRKYSEIKANTYEWAPVDKTLAGQVVTFAACPKGEYTLSYTGADKIQVFYEPDVDIDVKLLNSDGQEITSAEGFTAGEYTIISRIVDASTGEDVTSHELMGNNVNIKTYVKTSKDSSFKEYPNNSKISFNPDDKTEVYIEGKYLEKYTISSKQDPKLAWLSNIKVKKPSANFKIQLTAEQNTYKLNEVDSWKPIKATLTLEGQPLSTEQLAKTKFVVSTSDGLTYRVEPISGESAFNIYIAQDESGNKVMSKAGKYNITVSASFIDEFGEEENAKPESVSVEIKSVPFKMTVSAEQTWYKLSDHDSWKPVKVSLTINGKPLTADEFAATKLAVKTTDGLLYRIEPVAGESSYNVYISQDESGKYIVPNTGEYELTATATYTDQFGNDINSKPDTVSFEIQKYSKIFRILFWIFIVLLLFFIWLLFMLKKVMPKNLNKDTAGFTTISSGELDATFVNVDFRRKSKSLSISGSNAVLYDEQCSASFDLRAVDNRFTSSRSRRVSIIGIDSACEEIKIGGVKYINYEGRWIKSTDLSKAEKGKDISPLDQIVSCNSKFELSRAGGVATLTCKIKTT